MKDLTQLFKLVAKAVGQNKNGTIVKNHWFIHYMGHVNDISIKYYPHGWQLEGDAYCEKIHEELNEDGIQSAYWFINSRLEK